MSDWTLENDSCLINLATGAAINFGCENTSGPFTITLDAGSTIRDLARYDDQVQGHLAFFRLAGELEARQIERVLRGDNE